MEKYIIIFITAFTATLLFSPLVFKLINKIKAKQTILHHVKEHAGKQGTPTMGGIMFVFPVIVVSLCFFTNDFMFAVITLATFFAYGVLGFLDDFIKVKYKQNLGLRAYQKIVGQLGISVVIAIFVYNSIGGEIIVPFSNLVIDIGAWIIPLIVFVYVATVNSVNLIDGMDGLCASTSINYILGMAVILLLGAEGLSGVELAETNNLLVVCFSLLGALLAFLCFNAHPAKIFMGDTGSLAIGGAIASVSIMTKNILYIPLFGFVYVVTAVSDILQVAYYKKTKKRIFKMAPLHHHFQMSGIHENRVVFGYFIVSFILNLVICAFNI